MAAFMAAAIQIATTEPAQAADTDNAAPDAMVVSVSNGVLEAIRADKSIRSGDFSRIQALVNERIVPHVDFDRMTRLTVGRPWRTATAEQKQALIEQFRLLLMRTYAGALSRVSDEKVRLKPTHGQDAADDVVVRTEVVPSQGDAIQLDYRLGKTDAGWRIYDMNIMGVWLVENYKNEFRDTLNQSGVDGLIQALTQKNRKASKA
jgi:phospholipid transport system substrate-binding protein